MPAYPEAERIRCRDVCRMTSLSLRKVQQLAVAGKIPGAARIGGVWTFDPARVRAWIREQELQCLERPPISISGTASIGHGSRLPDASIEQRFAQLMQGKRRTGSKAIGKNSSARH